MVKFPLQDIARIYLGAYEIHRYCYFLCLIILPDCTRVALDKLDLHITFLRINSFSMRVFLFGDVSDMDVRWGILIIFFPVHHECFQGF